MVAQFRHTDDARLHQTPAVKTEKILNTSTSTSIIVGIIFEDILAGVYRNKPLIF